jgi:Imm-5 like putative immunity protein
MAGNAAYAGRRDPRFVTIRRGGTLDESHHRLLVTWAADCAEHVLALFTAEHPSDDRPLKAIRLARAWSRGEISMQQARLAAYAAHDAAREASGAAREAARAAGHAVATAHMADHELGAAAYAIRAVRAASPAAERDAAGGLECRWQRERLPQQIRELVLSDQARRNPKFWSLFTC